MTSNTMPLPLPPRRRLKSRALSVKLILAVLLSLATISNFAFAQQSSLVNREDALSAYADFAKDPIANLNLAPTFLRFIQTDGEAHIVLDEKLTTWMHEDHDPEVRAVLFAAYMGRNMNAQLTGLASGDDAVQGMQGVLDAYQILKRKHASLNIPMLETLNGDRENGNLDTAIKELQSQQ